MTSTQVYLIFHPSAFLKPTIKIQRTPSSVCFSLGAYRAPAASGSLQLQSPETRRESSPGGAAPANNPRWTTLTKAHGPDSPSPSLSSLLIQTKIYNWLHCFLCCVLYCCIEKSSYGTVSVLFSPSSFQRKIL